MPIIKSAIKKDRQDKKTRVTNRVISDNYKKAIKEFRKQATAGAGKKAQDALAKAYSALDVAAKKNILHKNNAARRKSRLSALLSKKPVEKAKAPAKAAGKTTKK